MSPEGAVELLGRVLALAILALVYRRWSALSYPDWVGAPSEEREEYGRAALSALLMIGLLSGAAAVTARQGAESLGVWPALPVAVGAWIAGRYGGRHGLASVTLTLLVFTLFIPAAAALTLIRFATAPAQGLGYATLMLQAWWDSVLPVAPMMMIVMLFVARAGSWRRAARRSPTSPDSSASRERRR